MIRKFILPVVGLFAAAALSACATPGGVAGSTVTDEKAGVAAEGAVQGAGLVAEAGVDTGVIKGNRAAVLDDAFTRAQSALGAARAADTLGQAETVEGQSIAALAVVVNAKGVLAASSGGPPPADADQPGDTSLSILTALAQAAPGVTAVIGDVGAALASDDETFIRTTLNRLRAANDELLARLLPKLKAAE